MVSENINFDDIDVNDITVSYSSEEYHYFSLSLDRDFSYFPDAVKEV